MSDPSSTWLTLYSVSIDHASNGSHILYSSRIDGALLPVTGNRIVDSFLSFIAFESASSS